MQINLSSSTNQHQKDYYVKLNFLGFCLNIEGVFCFLHVFILQICTKNGKLLEREIDRHVMT